MTGKAAVPGSADFVAGSDENSIPSPVFDNSPDSPNVVMVLGFRAWGLGFRVWAFSF